MSMTSGWMRTGMFVGVAAMMVAAISAGAQTTADDAAKAADAQAQQANVQAQAAAQQADTQAQMAKAQADMQVEMAPMQAKLAEQAAQIARQQVQLAPLREELARQDAQLAPLRAQLQAQMLPMQAKMEMMMAPMQAAMMARSAAMQASMMARSVVMQDGMVSVGDPQVKDDLFAGTEKFAAGASDVTDVNLGPDMLGMVSGKRGGDLAHKMNFMVVRTYEYPRTGMYKMEDVEAYRQKLRTGNWNCFVHTYESKSGESTDICNRALPNGQGNEMVILTVEPKELTFIHMSGNASLADLGRLGKMRGMGGDMPERPEQPERPEKPEKPEKPERL
jgi:hypothetical protein